MDKVEVDINGDGRFDDSWQFDVSEVKSVRWRFEELGPVYSPVVADFPSQLYLLNNMLIGALRSLKPGLEQDEVWNMIEKKEYRTISFRKICPNALLTAMNPCFIT